jgi:hypothetical protein
MGIKDKLLNQGSNLTDLDGSTPSIPNFANSRLHREYSINGIPNVPGKPSPSNLDLDGQTPSKYMNNLPE